MNKLFSFSQRLLTLFTGLLLFFACHITSTQETEETFTFPTLKDKIAGADYVNITLKDTAGNVIDVLFNGPVDSTTTFKNLSAKNYQGGKVVIDIEARQGAVVIYSVERNYDASKGGNQGQVVLIAPNMAVDFKLLSLRIREGEVVALPEIVILPADLGNKGLLWISRSPQFLEVAGQTLKALLPGKATLVVALQADSTRKDSLEVEVFSKNDPVKPIDTLLLSPDTLRLALKGPEVRFTVRTAPTTASPAAAWTSLNPSLFSIDSTGLLKPLAEGLGRVVAVSRLDATVSDTGFVLVLPPQKVDSVRFQKAKTELFVGGAAESLIVVVHPPLANPAVTLAAEDASLVSVSGLTLRGLKEGETRVFARSLEDPSKADTLTVILFPAERVDSVRLRQDSLKLYVRGESQALSAIIHPTTLQPRFMWRTADSKVATVDAAGKVSPVSAGKTFVSITARADAGKRDSALVIVKLDMPRLQVGQDTIISAGITLTHRPVVTQEYGLVVMFKWDLHGDGTFEDSSTTVPATLTSHYGEVRDYKAAFSIRDTEGNDTVYHRQIKTVTGRVVQITSPKDGSYTNQSSIPVNWTVDGQPLSNTQALNPGANTVTREARDSAGKVFSHTITVHLDQTPPNRPTVKTSLLPVNTLTPGWTWVSGGGGGYSTYRYRLDNPDMTAATVTTDTFFTAPTNLSEAVHTLYVQERDEAGNWSASGSGAVRIDTTAPSAPAVTVMPSGQTIDTRPTWSWTDGTGDAHRYYRYKLGNDDFRSGGKDTTGTAFRPTLALAEGQHTLYVQVRDSAGNWSASGSASVTIDLQAPAAPTVSVASVLTNDPTPTWIWTSATAGTVAFRHKFDSNLDVGATVTTDRSFTPGNLTEGTYTLYVQERDAAGNWSPSGSRLVRIDLTPPSAPRIDSTPYSPINTLRPKWTWKSGAGGARIFRARIDHLDLDGSSEQTDSSFVPSTNLVEGRRILHLQERDSAGNWSSSASREIVVSSTIQVGGKPVSSDAAKYNKIVVGSDGAPHIAYGGPFLNFQRKKNVLSFNGNSWVVPGGTNPYPPDLVIEPLLEVHPPSNRPMIGYFDNGIKIKYFSGNSWDSILPSPDDGSSTLEFSFTINNSNNPVVAYTKSHSSGGYFLLFKRYNGAAWVDEFTSNFSESDYKISQFRISRKNGNPFVSFIDDTGKIKIKSFQNSNWIEFSSSGLPETNHIESRFELNPNGGPCIILKDESAGGKPSVYCHSGSSWSNIGPKFVSNNIVSTVRPLALTFTSGGIPFVASIENLKLMVYSLRNGIWESLSPSGFTGDGFGVSIAMGPNDIPFVAVSGGDGGQNPSVYRVAFEP